MITRDGYSIILYTGLLLVALLVAAFWWQSTFLWVIAAVVAVIFVFHFFFFRDPERNIPAGERLILSPADGFVIKVDEVQDDLYFKRKVKRVAVFMTVFDVHVNRVPVSGKVEWVRYSKGKFKAAFEDEAALQNEQNAIVIRNDHGPVLFIQIAGLIARRIVSRLKEGDRVQAGQRFGMIKYSSRVDVFFPENVEIKVALKQKVKAGETVLGEFKT